MKMDSNRTTQAHVRDYFDKLKRSDAFSWFVLFLALVYVMFFLFSPVFRYGDDARYMATAKTIALSGNLAPKFEMFGDTEFYGPPLLVYVMTFFYFVSLGSGPVWFFLVKLFELAMFAGSLVIIYDFAEKFKLSDAEKIIALGLFAFLPITIYSSVSMIQDMVLTFLTLLLFWALFRKEPRYFLVFALSGLVMLSKYTGVLSVVGALSAVFLLKNDSKNRTLLLAAIILGALLIGGPWYYRNYVVFGDFLHHTAYSSYTTAITHEGLLEKVVNGYFSFWGIPPFWKITDKLAVSETVVSLAGSFAGLFLLPVVLLFLKGANENWKRFRPLLPFLACFLVFSFGYITLFAYAQERFFLPALGVFSLILATAVKDKRTFVYLLVCFVLLLSVAAVTTALMLQKEDSYKTSLERVNSELGSPVLQREDFDLRLMEALFFDMKAEVSDRPDCAVEKYGYVSFCRQEKFVFRDIFNATSP